MGDTIRGYLRTVARDYVRIMLTSPFETKEEREEVAKKVMNMTDDDIETIIRRMRELDEKRCPECGRPFDR